MAFELPILAFKRVPFGGATGDSDIVMLDQDWSGASFRMDLRPNPGNSGTPLLTLTTSAAGTQGISASYSSVYTHPITGEIGPATTIRLQIDEATIEGLAGAVSEEDDLTLYYDIHVTPSGVPKQILCFGTFTIRPGVTI